MAYFRKTFAIDLGTTSVLVFSRVKGVVLNEPSVVALDTYKDKILAVGQEAKEMLGRTPGHIIAMRPLRDGVIADYRSTERMLKHFIRKAGGRSLLKPDVIICVPSEATQVQKRAVLQAARAAGVHDVFLIEEPLAAAIGSGVDIGDPGGNMIVDIGGGTTDIAVISLGGIVISKSLRTAGDACDQAITDFIREKYDVVIGDRTAEDIKKQLGSTFKDQPEEVMEVKGRSLDNGLPVSVVVSSKDITEALEHPLNKIVEAIHQVLADTPPELAADLYDRGILLAGGGALIRGLVQKIQDRIGIEVHISDNPLTAVVRGTGRALSWIRKLESGDEVHYNDARRIIMQREALRKR